MFTDEELIAVEKRLFRFAKKLTRQTPDAEDLVQATMARSLEKRHLFETGTNLFSWASKIMYNLFVSELRKQPAQTLPFAEGDAHLDRGQRGRQMNNTYARDVIALMKELNEDQRRLINWVCIEDISYEDAADRLGLPIGTVRSRLARGRQALKEKVLSEERKNQSEHQPQDAMPLLSVA